MLFPIHFVAVTLSKRNKTIRLTYSKMEWPQNKLFSIWNYQYLQQIWAEEQTGWLKLFLRWYNRKNAVTTLEQCKNDWIWPLQRFWYIKSRLYISRFGLQKSTDAKLQSLRRIIRTSWRKFEKMFSVVIHCCYSKSICHWNFCSKISKHQELCCWDWCYPIIPGTMYQLMPTRVHTRCEFYLKTSGITPRQNKTSSFESMVTSCFQWKKLECKIESFLTTGRENKIEHFSLNGFCSDCNTLFETGGCFYHFFVRKYVPLSLKKLSKVAAWKQTLMNWDETLNK